MKTLPAKDPNSVEPYWVVWCSEDGTNDGTASDTGELQGATIATSNWTITPSGLTEDSTSEAAITIQGTSYAINTVAQIFLSGGTANTDYQLTNRITTNDGRTLDKTITVRCREQ